MPFPNFISITALGRLMPRFQEALDMTVVPMWVWLLVIILVIAIGVIWTLYEEEEL